MPYSTGRCNMYVYDINNGEYIQLRGVDFGKGAKRLSMTASANGSATVSVRLDATDGQEIAKVQITSTASVDDYRSFTAKVKDAKGVHDLYFCFDAVDGEVHLDCWQFEK